MSFLKSLVKRVIRAFLKIRIFLHHKEVCPEVGHEDLLEGNTEEIFAQPVETVRESVDLSLIIPVYNASKYLRECIGPLLHQKTDHSYEIICVDDGSSDDSLSILKEYGNALKVIHQENSGISAARNTGLRHAEGRYVGFIDNDDRVSEYYVERLLQKAKETDADYVRCSYEVFEDTDGSIKERQIYEDGVLQDLNDVKDSYRTWLHGYMWGGIYRRKIWEGFCFPIGFWYEDMVRNLYLYDCCQSLASVSEVLYQKRKHQMNAADVLWKKNDEKCLDQIRLLGTLLKRKKEENILSNSLSRYAAILEMGEYLYKRTAFLAETDRKRAFLAACDLKRETEDLPVDPKKDFEIYEIQKALKERDYGLYQLIGSYLRYKV